MFKLRDIILPKMKNNQTSNTCIECGKQWIDEIPTPGVLHRTILCPECLNVKNLDTTTH